MGRVEYVSLPIDKIQKDYNEEYVQTHNFLKNEKFEYNRYNGVDDFNIYRRTDTTLYTFIKENDYNIIYNCVIETNEIFTLVTFDNPNIEKIKCYIEGYSYHPIEQK
jgi:L-rhamnose mutarotase